MAEFISRVIAEAAEMGINVHRPPLTVKRGRILVSGLPLGPWMDEVYKEHFIRTDAKGSSEGWSATVQVSLEALTGAMYLHKAKRRHER
jgi:hypothetical protein